MRTWATTTPQLIKLRDRLVAEKVQRVMESTSDYWRPVFYVLSEQLDVIFVKASDVKAMPGRKSDVSDAEWLADLAAHQLVRASFVPPEQQRLEKNLEDACIKLFHCRHGSIRRLGAANVARADGLGPHGAEDLLAEIGPDMTIFEAGTEHLASWSVPRSW